MELDFGLGVLSLDLTGIPTNNPVLFGWWLFTHGGLWVVVVALIPILWQAWRLNRQHKYEHGFEYVLLAVDVPKETEQSPRAVEHIFSALAATYARGTVYDRLWKGRVQETFSFEIVSLGGYIQFLIRTSKDFRDLIEASIYSQYPNAEITQVEDYVGRIPTNFDTAAYDLWGTEFVFNNKNVYPIRTYPEFEHELSQEFKDPMAQLLETMGRINADEDIWLQLLVIPIDDEWKSHAKAEVEKIIKGQAKSSHGILYYLFVGLPLGVLSDLADVFRYGLGLFGGEEEGEELMVKERTIMQLTPGQRKVVEAIERKVSKIGFRVKFRMIYWGRRESFLKGRGVAAVVGAIQQFNTLDLNGFKPSKLVTTKAEYFLKESRINRKQKSMLRSYKRRSAHRGAGHGIIMNIEELATVYHFPVVTVKAPLVKKTELKKAEPPFALPVLQTKYLKPVGVAEPTTISKSGAPTNLPFVE